MLCPTVQWLVYAVSNCPIACELSVQQDSKSYYIGQFHIFCTPVHKDSWQYLGVHFIEDDGSVSFWTWRVLMLGIIDSSRSPTPILFEVASDASAVGHFSYIVNGEKAMLALRAFSEEERKESSTWRELTAFKDTRTNPDTLKKIEGTGIVHYTDNQAVVHGLAMGSRNARL